MLRLLTKSEELAVEFCYPPSRVCDAACRTAALRENARTQVLRYGGRLA